MDRDKILGAHQGADRKEIRQRLLMKMERACLTDGISTIPTVPSLSI